MKKLLSLVLAASMLASAYAPAVNAQADTVPTASEATATPETAASDAVQISEGQGPAVQKAARMSLSDSSEMDLSFRVTTADGIDFTSKDPFAQMTMVMGKKYAFQMLVGEKPLADAGYTLQDCRIPENSLDKLYLKVVSTDSETGTVVLTPTEVSTHQVFLGALSMTMVTPEGETIYPDFSCFGTTVADTGHALFVNADTLAPISELEATSDNHVFNLQIPSQEGWTPDTVSIDYGSTAPTSVEWTEGSSFGAVTVTVKNAISSDTSFYATVKDKTSGTVLATFSVALSWYTPIEAATLPGGDKICFGTKSSDTGAYSAFYSSQYNQVAGSSQHGMLSVFFGTPTSSGPIKDYHNQPASDRVTSIMVESLDPEVVTVENQTPSADGNPFTFQYTIQLGQCTTARLQATVTLENGTSYTALFTINVTENLETLNLTVHNGTELADALVSPQLTSGSIIYLDPGIYQGDFTVPTPVQLIASQYNDTEDLFTEDGTPIDKGNATVIEGTITATTSGVEVFGLQFQCPKGQSDLTALTDANLVTGCTFTGYANALVLAESVHNTSNYRVIKNAFVDNTVALRFAGREWRSNIQDNSFLDNDTALLLDPLFYIDGLTSTVYGGMINGGKWTNNFFRGAAGQQVLQDSSGTKDGTLVLDYNYYKYGSTVGSAEALFSADSCAAHDVFFTTPDLTAVSTSASLSALAAAGGLDLVAQQTDLASDSAVNASAELFNALKEDASAEDLTLNVWTSKEELAAVWEFPKDQLNGQAVDVNLAVEDTLSDEESALVNAQLPAGVEAQTVSFAHDGDLPGTATVEVPKSAELTSTEDLGLYYIDEATGKLELQDTDVTVTQDGKLQFSINHCSSYLVASKSSMTPQAPAAPEASVVTINYPEETLTFDADQYEVNTTADFTGEALASDGDLHNLIGEKEVTLYVRVKAQGDVPASAATPVTLPARPAAPTGLQTRSTSYADTADGLLTGTTASMEYKAADADSWSSCYGEQVTGLTAGSYQVRLMALSNAFASMPATVTVEAGPERNYSLSLTAPTFDAMTYGDTPVAKTLVITNTGNCDVMVNSFEVAPSDVFALQGSGLTVPNRGTLESYAVLPVKGLNAGSYEGTVTVTYQAGSETRTVSAALHLTVNKADATEAMTTVSGSAMVGSTGSLNLPALPTGASYGTPRGDDNLTGLTLRDGKLTFTMGDNLNAGETCTVTIPVTGAKNYNDYTLTITLTAAAKPVPLVTVYNQTRTYDGNAVTVEDLVKTATYDGEAVEGSWQFTDPDLVMKNAGTYTAQLRFTPADSTFDSAIATVSVTIQRRSIQVIPELTSNLVEVGTSINSIGMRIIGLVKDESLFPAGEAPDFDDFTGLPADTSEPGQWTISVTSATKSALTQSAVGQNYQITFLTLPLIVVEEDSTLEDSTPVAPDNKVKYIAVKSELQPDPDSAYDSVEKIEEKLMQELNARLDDVTEKNTRLQDISLLRNINGTYWEKVTDAFPQDGIQVSLDKKDLDIRDDLSNYTFTVLHLCNNGTIEQPAVTTNENGITFTLTSFSPVAVSWASAKPVQTTVTGSSDAGDAPSATPAPTAAPAAPAGDGTVYYTCPACGYHNWTATDEGYRCDHCSYLESVKQLSGYGNVKGVYTPQSSSAQAGIQSLLNHIPATGDESHPLVWVVLLVAAALGLGGLVWYKRRNR